MGGVLGGIAAYFNIDPLILRLIYLIVLFMGCGLVLYIILWIVVPPAHTAAERLEMRGEPVNVDNIKRMFEEGADRVKSGAEQMAGEAKDLGRKYGAAREAEHPRLLRLPRRDRSVSAWSSSASSSASFCCSSARASPCC